MKFKPIEGKDSTTEQIYKTQKFLLAFVRPRLEHLKPEAKKYWNDAQEFVDMYEFGKIKNWWEFFMTPEDWVRKYEKERDKESGQTLESGGTKEG